MSGIPVDMLVDIDGSYDRFSSMPIFRPSECIQQQDDDPFELCSMQGKRSARRQDLGLELGLALEKSIKLRSQQQDSPSSAAGTPVNPTQTNLGILINFDDSPDKKILNTADEKTACENHVKDSVFTHTASNPFELAWDVIQQEALNLAEHIQHDKEKTISPRKMVDLAMKLSPDSLLLSPRNDSRDEEILINSSPELDMKKTPRFTRTQQPKGRMSIGSSPVVARSYATPIRIRPSLANPSPLRKNIKPLPMSMPAPSPAKSATQKTTFKTPLLRSSSATAPLNHIPASKAPVVKAGPMKAMHQSHPPAPVKAPTRPLLDTPVRRSLAPSTVTAAPPPSLTFQSKLRAPLSRNDSDTQQPIPPKSEFQRQGSLRFASKRVSISHPPSSGSSNSSANSNSNRLSAVSRAKVKGRENVEP